MIEPHAHGTLDVGDGHRRSWAVCDIPQGKPAVVLHGGPGSGRTAGLRRFFDLGAYRIVLFDQRGCGSSTPHAADPTVDLSTNTTEHLLAVARMAPVAASWSSTRRGTPRATRGWPRRWSPRRVASPRAAQREARRGSSRGTHVVPL